MHKSAAPLPQLSLQSYVLAAIPAHAAIVTKSFYQSNFKVIYITEIIESLYEKGIFIPTRKLEIPERSKVTLRIGKIKSADDLKLVSYIKLMKEGEEAEKLFEF